MKHNFKINISINGSMFFENDVELRLVDIGILIGKHKDKQATREGRQLTVKPI